MANSIQKTHNGEELNNLLQEVEQALINTAVEADDNFRELRNRVHSVIESGKYSFNRLRAETLRRAGQADRFVHESPYGAMFIAAGIGAVVGVVISRHSNRPHRPREKHGAA